MALSPLCIHLKAELRSWQYRKQSHKNDKNFSQNSCSLWVGRSLGSNDARQLVKSVLLPNTAVWKQHYHIFSRGLNFQQNKLNCYIAEFHWGKGVRGLRVKTTKTSWSPEELAPLKIRTGATHVPNLFLGICKGREKKSWWLLHSRTTAVVAPRSQPNCAPLSLTFI